MMSGKSGNNFFLRNTVPISVELFLAHADE
jgi:hypothetical protein